MYYVLDLWLEEVPDLTIEFLRGVLIVSLVTSMVDPFSTGIQATGKIMIFQIAISLIMLINIPVSYLFLSWGMAPYSVMYVAIFTEVIALLARMIILNNQVDIDLRNIIIAVFLHNVFTGALLFALPALVDSYIPQTFWGLVVLCICAVVWSVLIILCIGFTKQERMMVLSLIKKRVRNY